MTTPDTFPFPIVPSSDFYAGIVEVSPNGFIAATSDFVVGLNPDLAPGLRAPITNRIGELLLASPDYQNLSVADKSRAFCLLDESDRGENGLMGANFMSDLSGAFILRALDRTRRMNENEKDIRRRVVEGLNYMYQKQFGGTSGRILVSDPRGITRRRPIAQDNNK